MMETNHFNRAALHWSRKCRPTASQWNTRVKGDGKQKRLSSVFEEALDFQHGFRQTEHPGLGASTQCSGTCRCWHTNFEASPSQLASVRDKEGYEPEVFLAPTAVLSSRMPCFKCSYPRIFFFFFFSHLTLIEICFDYWEKGSKLKQMHGD